MLKNLLLRLVGMLNMVVRYKNQVIKRNVANVNYGSNRRICGFGVDEEIRSTGSNPSGPPGVVDPLYQQASIRSHSGSQGLCKVNSHNTLIYSGMFVVSRERICAPHFGDG